MKFSCRELSEMTSRKWGWREKLIEGRVKAGILKMAQNPVLAKLSFLNCQSVLVVSGILGHNSTLYLSFLVCHFFGFFVKILAFKKNANLNQG